MALTAEITALDDSLTTSFNAHNLPGLMRFFAADVEFYHDTQGLQDFKAVGDGFRSLFASSDIRRERIGALEVYPIPQYGAIEVGAHRFCHTDAGRQDCGSFKFVHVWRHRAGSWQIARVVSYGH